jgi:D-arginine dehydrogenase
MREFDVAVIGAGMAGASVAWRLASSCSVVLVEREAQPGLHSTGRSAAMFMESYGAAGVRALTRASRAFYERPPDGFAPSRLLSDRGALYLAARGEDELLRETHVALAASGTELELLGADEAVQRVPCLRRERVHGALLEAAAQDIDVHALHQGFLRRARALGAPLLTGAVLQRAVRSGAHWELHFADGEVVRASAVVDAAGAWADELAATFGAAGIGLVPYRRSAFTFKAPEGMDVSRWPAVVGVDESYYFKPDAGQLLGSPANAEPTVPHDVMPEELDIAQGIHQIESISTLSIRRPSSTWAGLRSFVPDGELVIGWDDACPGFFWLAAQGGYGIQTAAGASLLAAALLLGRPVPDELLQHGVAAEAMSPLRLR